MSTTALIPAEARAVGEWRAPSQQQVALLKRTVAKGSTDDEFAMFLHICQRTGLDPFARQIYCIVRGTGTNRRATVQTSIDGFRLIAERTGCYAGSDEPLYDDERGAHPDWARVTVWKLVQGQRCPFTATARWSEYAQAFYDREARTEKLGDMWQRMPYLMLGKCAEALALRKAFPHDLSGMYTHDEMQQAQRQAPPLSQEPEGSAQELQATGQEIDRLLLYLGKDDEARAAWWVEVRRKYGPRLSPPLLETLKHILHGRVQKAAPDAPQSTNAPQDGPGVEPEEKIDPRASEGPWWRGVLEAHAQHPGLPQGLRDRISRVTDATLDHVGEDLANSILQWVEESMHNVPEEP